MAAEGTARARGAVGGVRCLSPLWEKRGSVARGRPWTTGVGAFDPTLSAGGVAA